jgi:fucose permease
MMLGAWCGALFVEMHIDLSKHLNIIVGSSLIFIAWMSRYLVQDRPDPALRHDGPLFRLPSQSLISIGIIAFCCMLGEGAMADWSVNYMLNITHSERTLAPIGLSAFATAMTIGRIFGDGVRLRLGDKKLMVYSGIIATSGLVFALIFPYPYTTIGGFFLVGLGLSTVVPIAYSIAGNTKEIPSGVGLAMVTTVGYAGFLFGPPIIGFIADWRNLRVGLSVVAVLFIAMTFLGLIYKKR